MIPPPLPKKRKEDDASDVDRNDNGEESEASSVAPFALLDQMSSFVTKATDRILQSEQPGAAKWFADKLEECLNSRLQCFDGTADYTLVPLTATEAGFLKSKVLPFCFTPVIC